MNDEEFEERANKLFEVVIGLKKRDAVSLLENTKIAICAGMGGII